MEETKEERGEELLRRNLQVTAGQNTWDPYGPGGNIMNSIHFYGYSGSLTEPPCSEFVEWHVMDTPMLVSREQLDQMRRLLFLNEEEDNVSGQCVRTSNHFNGLAVRQPVSNAAATGKQDDPRVHRCTCRDFLSDEDRRMDTNTTRCSKHTEQEQIKNVFF